MAVVNRFSAGLLAWVVASAMAQVPLQAPPSDPAAQADKTVVFIASDFKNGGVMGVYRGLEDGRGQRATQARILTRAIATKAHGIVLGGVDPTDFVILDTIAKKRPIGVDIFNDKQYAVANAKTETMKQTIEACKGYTDCKVLAIDDGFFDEIEVRQLSSAQGVEVTLGFEAAYDAIWNRK